MDGLRDVVGALRSLAGMRLQDAQRALTAARAYAAEVATALGTAVHTLPERSPAAADPVGRRAVVLCMSEHGFVGDFNTRLASFTQAQLRATDDLLLLGSRGVAAAAAYGIQPIWTLPLATRTANATHTALALSDELYRRAARGDITRIDLIYAVGGTIGQTTIRQRTLMPLDLRSLASASARTAPLHNLAPARLIELLTTEYVFALLTEATLESVASENAARFAAMDAAHSNVSKKLEGLRHSAREVRQSEITSELLDVVTGAEAMSTNSARN